MVRVPSNGEITPGGGKEFPRAAAYGRLAEARRGAQMSRVKEASRRRRVCMSSRRGVFPADWLTR